MKVLHSGKLQFSLSQDGRKIHDEALSGLFMYFFLSIAAYCVISW